jgi:hypothetical protein
MTNAIKQVWVQYDIKEELHRLFIANIRQRFVQLWQFIYAST